MTEYEKMVKGMIYDPLDPDVAEKRNNAAEICRDFNLLTKEEDKIKMCQTLWPESKNLLLRGQIYFDYLFNTKFGNNCYANYHFVCMDCAEVIIGNNVLFGPNVSLLTPMHPFIKEERAAYLHENGYFTDREYAKKIVIGDDCWICGNVTILGGVTIGEGTIIGAGSVVTRDIPSGVLAFGNPCRVIRKINEKDSIYLKDELWDK